MAYEPEAAGTTPASQVITPEQKRLATYAVDTYAKNLNTREAITLPSKLIRALSSINDTAALKDYLEAIQARVSGLLNQDLITKSDRTSLLKAIDAIAEKCGVELKGIAEAR